MFLENFISSKFDTMVDNILVRYHNLCLSKVLKIHFLAIGVFSGSPEMTKREIVVQPRHQTNVV